MSQSSVSIPYQKLFCKDTRFRTSQLVSREMSTCMAIITVLNIYFSPIRCDGRYGHKITNLKVLHIFTHFYNFTNGLMTKYQIGSLW